MRRRTAVLSLLFSSITADAEPVDASLINLIASPKDFDGKQVRIIGFVRLEFEGNAIYLHEEDYKRGLTKNGLWLDLGAASKRAGNLNNQYVLVEGTFSMRDHGHMDLWSGAIQNITRFVPWRLPR